MKFGKMMHIVPYKGKTVKISNFWKSKMAAATILKNHKNRDISETVWPIFTKFGTIMQNRSLNCSLKIWISKIQDGGRLPIWKAVISPYLRNRLTDFDEICHDYTNWPSTEDGPLKVWIFLNQDGGGRHLKKSQKSRYLRNGLTGLYEIWYASAKWVCWPLQLLNNLNFTDPRWRTAAILKTIKMPHLCNRLTDF